MSIESLCTSGSSILGLNFKVSINIFVSFTQSCGNVGSTTNNNVAIDDGASLVGNGKSILLILDGRLEEGSDDYDYTDSVSNGFPSP